MKKRILCVVLGLIMLACAGCSGNEKETTTAPSKSISSASTSAVTEKNTETTSAKTTETETQSETAAKEQTTKKSAPLNTVKIVPSEAIKNLLPGFSYAEFKGDDGLSAFLSGGGVSSDEDLTNFLVKQVLGGKAGPIFKLIGGGCSTLSVKNKNGGYLFGRNFDWKRCNGLALVCKPSKGYKSVSTVNTDFVTTSTDYKLTDDILRFCALYAPLDGMNEKGVCVSVNMVFDKGAVINQQTSKPDLTTSTAIRLILDRAASAKQAVELLRGYDMHASFGYVIHFAICDSTGYSVAVEYINNKMTVTETPVLTNFYVTPSKFGIGSQKSVKRYDLIMDALKKNPQMTAAGLRDVMKEAAQSQLNDYSTEWTAIFDQSVKTVTYYHRGSFNKGYTIYL